MTGKRFAFAVLALVQVNLIAAISLLAVAMPAIQIEFGLDPAQLTLVTAGYGLAFSGLLILGGRLGDAYGASRTFVMGLAIFGLASAAGGFATSFGLLLTARFAQGIGAALAAPAALAVAGALFDDPGKRTRALAIWGGLSASGAVAGMLLSGAIVAWAGWRWVFTPPTLISLFALAALSSLIRRKIAVPGEMAPNLDTPPRLDVLGSVLVTSGLVAVTYGLVAMTGESRRDHAWAMTVLGVLLLTVFIKVEARAAHPLLPLAFFKIKQRRLALATIVLASAASATTSFFLSLFLQQVRNLSPLQTSAYFLPMLLIVGAGTIADRWIRLVGPMRVTAAGLACAALGLYLIAQWMNPGGAAPFERRLTTFAGTAAALDSYENAGHASAFTPPSGPASAAAATAASLLAEGPRVANSTEITRFKGDTRATGDAGDAGITATLGLAGLTLFPLGLGLSFSGAAVAALRGVPDHEQGLAGGVVNTAMEVGPTAGLAALVAISRIKATAMVQAGASWAHATAAGYALALATAAFLFACLAALLLAALHRARDNPAKDRPRDSIHVGDEPDGGMSP